MSPFGLAWCNLVHKRARSAVAVAGVTFAVVLIFMELGMFGGVERTATALFNGFRFELIITSSEYNDVGRPGDLARIRLAQARAADGVVDVLPVSLASGAWQRPARNGMFGPAPPGSVGSIGMIGVPPARVPDIFSIPRERVFPDRDAATRLGNRLARRGTILFDKRSKPDFGALSDIESVPEEGTPNADPDHPGIRNLIRLNDRRIDVVGGFQLGSGFAWNGMLLTSEETFADYTGLPIDRVTFGLVTLEPGTNPAAVQKQLREMLPNDVRVRTREQMAAHELRYWMQLTSVGQFLGVAVALAIVVGAIFVYQMMVADIRGMLPEYATVKALGYRPRYLSLVVVWQALLLAVFGYTPGIVAALGLYSITRNVGGIPTEMTLRTASSVLAMTFGMCLVSGLLAVRKVHAAQPADLF